MAASNEAVAGKVRKWLRLVTAVLCGTMLLALTFVTVIDVVGRYVLNHPLPGAGEYTELLLMSIIFVGLPAVCLDDGHISVDLLTTRFTGWLKAAQLMLTGSSWLSFSALSPGSSGSTAPNLPVTIR